jgi:catechol 2,3-dioxygenase-like lactoylglutathione lyase family enzyme
MGLSIVDHVALTVTDLARSKECYGRVLGWAPVMDGEASGVRFSVGALPVPESGSQASGPVVADPGWPAGLWPIPAPTRRRTT